MSQKETIAQGKGAISARPAQISGDNPTYKGGIVSDAALKTDGAENVNRGSLMFERGESVESEGAARDQVREFLLYQGAPHAAEYLAQVAAGLIKGDRARNEAAKTVLDRAGVVPPHQAAQATGKRDLTAMSSDELRAFLAQAENQLAARANPVSAQDSAQTPPKRRTRQRKDTA